MRDSKTGKFTKLQKALAPMTGGKKMPDSEPKDMGGPMRGEREMMKQQAPLAGEGKEKTKPKKKAESHKTTKQEKTHKKKNIKGGARLRSGVNTNKKQPNKRIVDPKTTEKLTGDAIMGLKARQLEEQLSLRTGNQMRNRPRKKSVLITLIKRADGEVTPPPDPPVAAANAPTPAPANASDDPTRVDGNTPQQSAVARAVLDPGGTVKATDTAPTRTGRFSPPPGALQSPSRRPLSDTQTRAEKQQSASKEQRQTKFDERRFITMPSDELQHDSDEPDINPSPLKRQTLNAPVDAPPPSHNAVPGYHAPKPSAPPVASSANTTTVSGTSKNIDAVSRLEAVLEAHSTLRETHLENLNTGVYSARNTQDLIDRFRILHFTVKSLLKNPDTITPTSANSAESILESLQKAIDSLTNEGRDIGAQEAASFEADAYAQKADLAAAATDTALADATAQANRADAANREAEQIRSPPRIPRVTTPPPGGVTSEVIDTTIVSDVETNLDPPQDVPTEPEETKEETKQQEEKSGEPVVAPAASDPASGPASDPASDAASTPAPTPASTPAPTPASDPPPTPASDPPPTPASAPAPPPLAPKVKNEDTADNMDEDITCESYENFRRNRLIVLDFVRKAVREDNLQRELLPGIESAIGQLSKKTFEEQECTNLLDNIMKRVVRVMDEYAQAKANASRAPSEWAQAATRPPVNNMRPTMQQPQPQWRTYFEGLPRVQQRQFAGIFGPQVARTEQDFEILQKALQDDGRVAKLTPMYAPGPVNRRAVMFRNAYLDRR